MDAYAIQEMGTRCIHHEPAACIPTCPLHGEVRTMLQCLRQSQFDEALQVYRKQVSFPEILSRICDHPCEKQCLRKNADEGLAIRSLEKACVDYGRIKTARSFPVPPKKKRVAVIGGGLSGLACAYELIRKGFEVNLYEQGNRLGGRLWEYDRAMLPEEVIGRETSLPVLAGVKIFLNTRIDHWDELDADVVFLSSVEMAAGYFQGFDPVSLSCEQGGIFGRNAPNSRSLDSPVWAVAEGLRAARSIERYFQKVSLTSGREKEGSYETQGHTTIPAWSGIQKRVKMSDAVWGYTQAEAISEAARCWLCACTECRNVCVYIRHYKEFPDSLVRAIGKNMYAYPSIGKSSATSLINACSLCGLCGEVCPEDLDMTEASLNARRIMVERGIMPLAVHDFSLRDMLFSNSEAFFLVRHQPGKDASRYVFFPGCQLGASDPDYVIQAYRFLTENYSGGVGLVLGCCGVPAEWAGRKELFQQQTDQFLNAWKDLGQPQVILACPTCLKMFRQYLPQVACRLIWGLVEENEWGAGLAERGKGKTLAVHDPCASRYDRETQDCIRRILEKLGYILEEIPLNRERTQCCGLGGLVATVNPELAAQITAERIQASSRDYVTYCANCRDDFARYGKPTWHLLDLLFCKEMRTKRRARHQHTLKREKTANG
jgi:Fe-S oxidoreductase